MTASATPDLDDLKGKLDKLPKDEKIRILALMNDIEVAREREAAQDGFMNYIRRIWPDFIAGQHHEVMADAFDRIVEGDLKRLIITMPPRHTKSEFGSHYLPSYFLGKHPKKKVIQSSHTAELASGFGRKVRDTIETEQYQSIFTDTRLDTSNKASHRWGTEAGGQYFAIGVGGSIAGKGADLFIIDDPHSEQDIVSGNLEQFDKTYEWYTSGPRQRLQPGAAIVIIMTRWHMRDLVGRVLKKAIETGTADEWEIIEFPAILPSEEPLWPEFWSIEELMAIKNEIPVYMWNAQYMQNPTSEEGAIIKRDWWKVWKKDKPPECDFVIQAWDTAFSAKEKSDFSACTTWGVFTSEDKDANIILLDSFKGRWEFPELKEVAHKAYMEWKPDCCLVEQRASGTPLTQELRMRGLMIVGESNARGTKSNPNDKISRMNSISDIFSQGMVWAPEKQWAEELIESCAEFPFGEHDDDVDSMMLAIKRFRDGGYVRLKTDEDWIVDDRVSRWRVRDYY